MTYAAAVSPTSARCEVIVLSQILNKNATGGNDPDKQNIFFNQNKPPTANKERFRRQSTVNATAKMPKCVSRHVRC